MSQLQKGKIVIEPNRILHRVSREVPLADISLPRIQRLIAQMRQILAAAPDGVGLAGPQIGANLRIFIVSEEAEALDRGAVHDAAAPQKKKWGAFVFINPILKKTSRKKIEMAEGCLSLPKKYGVVPRAEKLFLCWHDERGKKHERGFSKFFARVIQHELDHLDGILITDRAARVVSAPERDR